MTINYQWSLILREHVEWKKASARIDTRDPHCHPKCISGMVEHRLRKRDHKPSEKPDDRGGLLDQARPVAHVQRLNDKY